MPRDTTEDGKFVGEVVDGQKWDGTDWVEHVGVDFSENPPEGFVNSGDGSPEHPHNIVRESAWR